MNFFPISDFGQMSSAATVACVEIINSYDSEDELWGTVLTLISEDGKKLGIQEVLSKLNLCSGFEHKQIDAVTDSIINAYANRYLCSNISDNSFVVDHFLTDLYDRLENIENWQAVNKGILVGIYTSCGFDDVFISNLLDELFNCEDLINKSISYDIESTLLICNCANVVLCNKMIVDELIQSVDEESILYYGFDRCYNRTFNDIKNLVADIAVSQMLDILAKAIESSKLATFTAVEAALKICIKLSNVTTAEDLIRAQYCLDMSMTLRSACDEHQNDDNFELLFKAYEAALISTYSYCDKISDKDTEENIAVFKIYYEWLSDYSDSAYDNYASQKKEFASGNIRPNTNVKRDFSRESVIIYPDGFKVGDLRKITYFSNYSISEQCQYVSFAHNEKGDGNIWSEITLHGNEYNDLNLDVYFEDGIHLNELNINLAKVIFHGDTKNVGTEKLHIDNDIQLTGIISVEKDASLNVSGDITGKITNSIWKTKSSVENNGELEVDSLKGSLLFYQEKNDEAKLVVNKDIEMQWTNTPSPYDIYISKGEAAIKGNVHSLLATGDAMVTFCGTSVQQLYYVQVNNAETVNSAGIEIINLFDLYGVFKGNNNPIKGVITIHEDADPDINTFCDFKVKNNNEYKSCIDIEKDLVLNGNVTGDNITVLDGVQFTINGNCKSRLTNNGTTTINGDQW